MASNGGGIRLLLDRVVMRFVVLLALFVCGCHSSSSSTGVIGLTEAQAYSNSTLRVTQ